MADVPTVVVCTDGTVNEAAPCTDMLRSADFDVRFAIDPHFAHGECNPNRVINAIEGASAVLAWGEPYSAAVLDARPGLRVVARIGVGYDNVDIAAATARNVVVTITPTANHECVAEHALALMLALAKRIVSNDRLMRAGQWPSDRGLLPLRGRTLGIVGLGRTGRSLAVRAAAMGMRVIAHDIAPDAAFARRHVVEMTALPDLLARSDFVSLHCPLNRQTRHLIGAAELAAMQPGAVLVNVARGGLVDESALERALAEGRLDGAGLDVFATEPTSTGHPLFAFENVVASPHIAGNDATAIDDMMVEAARCVVDLKEGRWPDAAVINQQLRGSWKWTTGRQE